jgi:hypothetical protein
MRSKKNHKTECSQEGRRWPGQLRHQEKVTFLLFSDLQLLSKCGSDSIDKKVSGSSFF